MGNSEKLMMAAFYKYGVKAIRFMFAVLKELSGFIPADGGKNPRNLLNTQKNAAYHLPILNCTSKSFLEFRKIIISSPNCFYVKLCNQNLWREKITCHTHVILRTGALGVLKQNWANGGVRRTTVWSGARHHSGETLCELTFWPHPHKTRKLPPASVSSDIVTTKVEGPDKICYDDF